MSGFADDAFGDSTIENPFADPSITQVTSNTQNVRSNLEEYNPFADQQTPVHNAGVVRGTTAPSQYTSSSPAIMQPTQEVAPPQYTRSGAQSQNITTAEFQRRQEELDRKAAELERREEELRNASYNARRNNWPPLPENNLVQPCFYQDISVEIPSEFQRVVRHLYYLWIFHGCIMLFNIIGGMALMIQFSDFTTFGVAILYFMLFTPFSFLCWFRPAYKAFRSDSSFNFMVFFFVFFFQFIVTVMQTIGLPGSGFCGFITAISCLHGTAGNIVVGVFLLCIAMSFGTAATGDLLLLSKIHKIYRSSGASFAKAQQEFTSEFLRNEHVQNAATNAAAATLRSQMGGNQSSNRY